MINDNQWWDDVLRNHPWSMKVRDMDDPVFTTMNRNVTKIFLSLLTSGSGSVLICYVPGDVVWNCAECPAWDKPPTEESGCVDPASIGCWKIDIFFIKSPYATLCFKVCVHFNTIFWIFRHTSHQEMVALYIKFIL